MSEFSLFSKFHTKIINNSDNISVLTVCKGCIPKIGKYDIYLNDAFDAHNRSDYFWFIKLD